MKVLVDAQLPRRLVETLRFLGWDAIHTLDLPLGNQTPDPVVAWLADVEERFVVTKDADFVHSNLLGRRPLRLLLVATGNVANKALVALFVDHALEIESLAEKSTRLTLSTKGIVVGLSRSQ